MIIRQPHAQQSPITSTTAAKPAAKAAAPSSFSALLGSLTPKVAPSSNYRPVGTIHGSFTGQVATGSTTPAPTTPTTPAPFSPIFQQGATVTAPDGSTSGLNPMELASPQTAQEVAALLGGTVTQDNPAGGFSSSVATLEISVPGSSNLVNRSSSRLGAIQLNWGNRRE
jgi:hypothetical protein